MPKREFLMLAHTFKEQNVKDWFISEKLDGCRAYWDGGISRGILASQVPYANVEKDARYVVAPVATGLWSRYGKVIHAPDKFINSLPNHPLDGELWTGRGNFQNTMSTVKQLNPDSRWDSVQYKTFDVPPYDVMFAPGEINNINFKKKIKCLEWVRDRAKIWPKRERFKDIIKYLSHEQKKDVDLTVELDRVMDLGGEGLMLRNPNSFWLPERSHNLLKVKKRHDAEAEVVGYVWGLGKLLGLMGALKVKYKNVLFELSGFTDNERQLISNGEPANALGEQNPGKVVPDYVTSKWFPRGSKVTFRYRELTDAGIPKEASYYRVYTSV